MKSFRIFVDSSQFLLLGNLKREHPTMNEEVICLRAIRDVNVPKFLLDDLKLFRGIVSDLFPKIKEEAIDYGVLMDSIKNSCPVLGVQAVDGNNICTAFFYLMVFLVKIFRASPVLVMQTCIQALRLCNFQHIFIMSANQNGDFITS